MIAQLTILLILLAIPIYAAVPDIDARSRSRLGIVTEDLAPAELAPTIPATATVLDPAPLVALLRQAESAAKTTAFSRKSLTRAEKLFLEGNLVPQKTVDAARAQLLTDEAAHRAILDSIIATYGKASSDVEPDDLLKSGKILIRFSTRENPEQEPLSATVGTSTTNSLTRAPIADPVFQNLSWLSVMDSNNYVPGMVVPATLTLPGEVEKGHLLPSSAIIWHLGHPWVFHEATAGNFERINVQITTRIPGGYLITDPNFPMTAIVTTGAQLILSSEISEQEE